MCFLGGALQPSPQKTVHEGSRDPAQCPLGRGSRFATAIERPRGPDTLLTALVGNPLKLQAPPAPGAGLSFVVPLGTPPPRPPPAAYSARTGSWRPWYAARVGPAGFLSMLRRCSCVISLAVMLVGLLTAQAADTTLMLTCKGTANMTGRPPPAAHRAPTGSWRPWYAARVGPAGFLSMLRRCSCVIS